MNHLNNYRKAKFPRGPELSSHLKPAEAPPLSERPKAALKRFFSLAIVCLIVFCANAAEKSPARVTLNTRFYHFEISAATGHVELIDNQTHVTWGSSLTDSPFGTITVKISGKGTHLVLGKSELVEAGAQGAGAMAVFHPVPNDATLAVRVRFQGLADQRKERSKSVMRQIPDWRLRISRHWQMS